MDIKKYLGKTLKVLIDRPIGAVHPTHGYIYPINYGHIKGTISADGEELDAYVLGINELIDEFTGKCIAIIERLNDDDPKLIVVPTDKDYSDDDIRALTEFQEKFFKSIILRN
jgi:inorganic pyrophosphatase